MTALGHPSREDVLDAFSVEPDFGRETLERYLHSYPDYAEALVDLSRELSREICESQAPLLAEDKALIDAAWRRHALAPKVSPDPFAALSTADLREVARRLDVPRQIVTAFRERRVILSSVPRRFLVRFADAVNSSVETLEALWSELVPAPSLIRSYKADAKPTASVAISFEQLLIDAQVPESKRVELMTGTD